MEEDIIELKKYRDILAEGTLGFNSLSNLEMDFGICTFVIERLKNSDIILDNLTDKRDDGRIYLCTTPRQNKFSGRPIYEGQEERIEELDRLIKVLEDNN